MGHNVPGKAYGTRVLEMRRTSSRYGGGKYRIDGKPLVSFPTVVGWFTVSCLPQPLSMLSPVWKHEVAYVCERRVASPSLVACACLMSLTANHAFQLRSVIPFVGCPRSVGCVPWWRMARACDVNVLLSNNKNNTAESSLEALRSAHNHDAHHPVPCLQSGLYRGKHRYR